MGHWKCPHNHLLLVIPCHTHVIIQICVLINHINMHTHTHTHTHTPTHTHTHTQFDFRGIILEELKRSLNAKAHTHTHTDTYVSPPLTQVAFLQRICSISKINPNPDISARQQALRIQPTASILLSQHSLLSQYKLSSADKRDQTPSDPWEIKSHTSHDFLLVHDYSTRLINRGSQFWRLNYIRIGPRSQ